MKTRRLLGTHETGRSIALALLGFALYLLMSATSVSAAADLIPRDSLVADVKQLVFILETAHPDPYINGGGKIAFHRRIQEALLSIPEQGMTASDFLDLLRPVVASLGDSHTMLRNPSTANGQPSLGLPLDLKIIEQGLYVAGVYSHNDQPLLGARLVAIEGVPLSELLLRQSRERGLENQYTRLAILSRSLKTGTNVCRLIPEWQDSTSIRVSLESPSRQLKQYTLPLVAVTPDSLIRPATAIETPSTAHSDVVYSFLDSRRSTALLVISDMMRYREGCEQWYAEGMSEAPAFTQAAYQHFYGDSPIPQDKDSLLAAIPAATETFVNLSQDMKRAGTKTLIVDLRDNTGGNSVMLDFLIYFLYGDSTMKALESWYSVTKLSSLYFEVFSNESLATINKGRAIPLTADDYIFDNKLLKSSEDASATPDDDAVSKYLQNMPTFWKVYQQGSYGAYYRPERIIVLCSPFTFSSGFNLMTALYKLGARVVGTPSAQAGNNFGDALPFSLKHSGINGFVSHKQVITFPDDAEKGRCLMPDVLLTYKKLASYGFDPNAELRLALEFIDNKR